MLEPRVYRAAFVPALLALVLAAFSLQSRPRPAPQGLAADVLFDGRLAAESAATLAERHRDRRAGSLGDRATATEVARTLSRRGFRVERQAFRHAGADLVNVIGRRAGRSRRQLVIMAGRDASGVPDASGSAADTAALLELARVFQGRPSRKTLVLASVDGSTLGEVGTEKLLGELGAPDVVDGVLVISDLASRRRRGSLIVPWSNGTRRAGIGLQRTVADSIRQELDQAVGSAGALGQLARLSFPLGIGAQGVLLDRGYEAVRVSGSGELPPEGPAGPDQIDEDRLGGLGRATLRTMTALDVGRAPDRGPGSYVLAVSQLMPGWAIGLLALTLLVPALVASIDAFARARRRRLPVAPWIRWLAVWVAPLVGALIVAELLSLAGATPHPPPAPPAPEDYPLDGPAVAVLAGVALTAGLLWWAGRSLALHAWPELADPSAAGAACAVALTVCFTALVLWVLNPFAALVLVPAAHLWMLATLGDPAPPRRARTLLVVLGVVPPALVVLYWLLALSLDPLSGAWYLLLLVTGGSVGAFTALLGCVLLGSLGAVSAAVRTGEDEPVAPAAQGASPYGLGGHAGPGALGGTESALRR